MNANQYRDRVREIAHQTIEATTRLIAEARESGLFAPDHTNDLGDPDSSALVKAESDALAVNKLLWSIGDRLTLPMSRKDDSATAIPQ